MNIKQFASRELLYTRITSFFKDAETWLVKILFGQLFLTTFSLPLLLWWGLPLSALTIIGNIIFNPFIGLFLLLCTLLFFCELLYIPSSCIVWLLEHLSDVWLWCVAQGSRHALIALPRPSGYLMVGVAACALWIMYHFSHNQKSGVFAFSLFLLTLGVGLRYGVVPNKTLLPVSYGSRSVVLVAADNKCFLFDVHGVLRPGNQSSSWSDFTLRSELVTMLGRISCDAIVVMRPTQARLQAACEIAQKIKTIYVVVPAELWSASLMPKTFTKGVYIVTAPQELLLACCSENQELNRGKCVKKLWYTIKNFKKIDRDFYVRKNE